MTGLLLLAGSVTFGAEARMFAPPAAFLLFHAVESNLVTPWIVGRRLRLAPLSVFLSVMLWGWLWGIAGAFVAVPILLGLRTVFSAAAASSWPASTSKAMRRRRPACAACSRRGGGRRARRSFEPPSPCGRNYTVDVALISGSTPAARA